MTSWIACLSIAVMLASRNPESSQDSLRVMTSVLLEALHRYEHARPAERSTLRARLARVVTARGEALERIAREQPEAVLAIALPAATRHEFPADMRSNIEERVEVKGWLDILISDGFTHGRSWTDWYLDRQPDGGLPLRLVFAGAGRLSNKPNEKFNFRGLQIGNVLVVAALSDLREIPGERLIRGRTQSAWLRVITSRDPAERLQACDALGGIDGTSTPAVVTALILALEDSSAAIRQSAAMGLYRIGAGESSVSDALHRRLADPVPPVRFTAALALAHCVQRREEARDAVPVLLEALEAKDWWIRNNAFRELGEMGPFPEAALPHLVAVVDSNDIVFFSMACEGLAALGPRARPALGALRRGLLESHRSEAAASIAAIDSANAARTLVLALRDPRTRAECLRVLGGLGRRARSAESAIRAWANDPDEDVREAAVQALRAVGAKP